MSTAEYERLGEIRDVLEETRDLISAIETLLSITAMTVLFWLTLRAGWWKALADA